MGNLKSQRTLSEYTEIISYIITIFLAEDNCITVDGPSSGLPCIFPFVYKGLLHKTCTYLDSDLTGGKPWCSTLVDITGHHVSGQGNWGICDSNCPMPKGKAYGVF